MAKAIDWSGVSKDALERYAREQLWTRSSGGGSEWTYTTGSPRSRLVRMVSINVKKFDAGEIATRLRTDREPLSSVAERLRELSEQIAARKAAAAPPQP